MKYFTKELWLGMQDLSNAEASERDWSRRLNAYRDSLSNLRDRLPAAVMFFFEEADVHDGQLGEFRVFQPALEVWDGSPDTEHPVGVDLVVHEDRGRGSWRVKYSSVRRVTADYPSDTPLFPTGGGGFGDWGYHELMDAGDGFLRHEVLFATGATLLVEFRDVVVERASPSLTMRP
jgi:hypothetical protein